MNSVGEKDILAIIASFLGGFIRVMLSVDPDIPKWKQFVILFIGAGPFGFMFYMIVKAYDYEVLAYLVGFSMGIMALSAFQIMAKDGFAQLVSVFLGRK